MKKVCVEALRWLVASVLSLAALLAFFMVIGDPNPDTEMSVGTFLLIKAAALVVLVICGFALFWLDSTGNLPQLPQDFYRE